MATNQRGSGLRVSVTVSEDRASGEFCYESGFHGSMVNKTLSGAVGVMDITQTEVELPLVSTAAKGDAIYIAQDGDTLSKTSTNHRLVGFVTEVTADNADITSSKMRMLVAAQNATVPSA